MLHDDHSRLSLPCLSDRAALTDADGLIARYGDDAGFEASARAELSRDRGNALGFARWREVERLILFLASDEPVGSIH